MAKENIFIIKRDELYELVWSTPMTILAKRYNLSDNGLRKICKKLEVPRPANGYWSKLRVGKKVSKIPLPPLLNSEQSTYELNIGTPKLIVAKKTDIVIVDIAVPKRLTDPHPLIRSTLQRWEHPNNYSQDESLWFSASDDLKHRVLLILNTIFKYFETNGYKIGGTKESRNTARVQLDDMYIEFRLTEPQKRYPLLKKNSYDPMYEFKFNGELVLTFDFWNSKNRIQRKFSDSKKHKLEDQLPSFISNIKLAFKIEREWKIDSEIRRQEEHRRQLIEQERQRKLKEEQQKIELLTALAKDHRKSKMIRDFIAEVHDKYMEELNTNTSINTWLIWAESVADSFDPLLSLDFLNKFTAT
jgi:DNA-binding Lrp family transcriptional regulator